VETQCRRDFIKHLVIRTLNYTPRSWSSNEHAIERRVKLDLVALERTILLEKLLQGTRMKLSTGFGAPQNWCKPQVGAGVSYVFLNFRAVALSW
jgi:hypothetical protein